MKKKKEQIVIIRIQKEDITICPIDIKKPIKLLEKYNL
jgi:hypothetical protein